MQVEAPCREAGAMLVLKTRGAVISEFSKNGGCAGTSRWAWTCNCATPRAHELHTDMLDHPATPEADGMSMGRGPDTAAGGVI